MKCLAPAVEVEYTPNQPMVLPVLSSCSRSPNWLPGTSRKGLGDHPAPLHPPHPRRERTDGGAIGAGGWRHGASFNQVLSEAQQAAGTDRTFCEGFSYNSLRQVAHGSANRNRLLDAES